MDITSSDGIVPSARWSLRLFGGFELSRLPGGERVALPAKRDRVLLAYLALSPNYRQPRRKLTTLLWGDASDETALDNLRVCVWSLRKALGDAQHRIIASEGDDIVLDVAAFEADVLAFRRIAAQPERAELEAAAKLYAGEFLGGLSIESGEFETWRRAEATRFRDEATGVLIRLMTQFGQCGETERAIEIGQRILTLEPLNESAIRGLMRLQNESGRRAVAIQLYRTFADALRTELDAQPEAETRAVFAEIARGGGERTDGPAADATLPSPPPRLAIAHSALRQAKTRKPAWMLAGGLAAALAIALLYQFVPLAGTTTGKPIEAVSSAPVGTIAIAVLPFANLSSDAEQEFFSDGVTEEITSALARVPNLHVVARTSAFEFKGQNRNIKAIAQQLNATHVIEGSVRKAGDQVRITAQLIQADNGLHLWTDSYDRQLTNIFAVQEEIAQAIAGALRVPLGLAPGETLVSSRAIDPASYQEFLRAKALVQMRAFERLTEAIKLLESVVARDPDFAPAWGQLALVYPRMPFFSPQMEYAGVEEKRRAANQWLAKADKAAERAIELDASLPDGYSALGLTMAARGRYLGAEELFTKALALDPFYPEALHSYANLLGAVGRTEEALAMRRQLLALEPFVLVYRSGIEDLLWISGQTDTLISNLTVTRSATDLAYLARIYSAQGRHTEAADTMIAIPPGRYPDGMVEAAVRLLRTSPADPSSSRRAPRLGHPLDFVYIRAGVPERTLERFEDDVSARYSPPYLMIDLWTPIYAPVRKTERFRAFARDAGLVEYWRAKGWPQFCHPTTGDDFVCD